MDEISLLTTLDQNYLPQLQVLLTSLSINNPGERFRLYLLHSGIPDQDLAGVRSSVSCMGIPFFLLW